MKQFYMLLMIIAFGSAVNAQKVYTINASGEIVGDISTAPNGSYVFKIPANFAGSKFEVYDDQDALINTGCNVLSTDIPKDAEGTITVTISDLHKIKECPKSLFTISDMFSVKLNSKLLGKFSLTSLKLPGGGDGRRLPAAPGPDGDSYLTGSVINDAIFIANNLNNGSVRDKIIALLENHYNYVDTDTKNKYLNAALPKSLFAGAQGGIDIKGITNAVGGLNVTSLADGFTKFAINRTVQELSISYFKRLKEDIAANPDLNAVFPATTTLLGAIDKEITQYSNYINNLREAFRSDLLVIDENVPAIIDNHPNFFNKPGNELLAPALKSGSYIANALKHETHPGDIIDGYPISYLESKAGTPPAFKKIKPAIQLLQLFSASLKETDTAQHRYWTKINKIRTVVNDEKTLQIYLGLLLQTAKEKYGDIPFSTTPGDDFFTVLNGTQTSFKQNYSSIKEYFLGLGSRVEELDLMVKNFDKTAPDSVKVELIANFFKTTVQFIKFSTKASELKFLANKLDNLAEESKNYFNIAVQVTDLVTAINRKRYPEVVNHVLVLYNAVYASPAIATATVNTTQLSGKQKAEIADLLVAQYANDPGKTVQDVFNNNPKLEAEIKKQDPEAARALSLMSLMAKYGAFMTNMIGSNNSDQIAESIEKAALPVGSASIKRETSFNVSLNAYADLFAGNEVIKGFDSDRPFSKFNTFGLTLPIGISISKGNSFLPWPLCFLENGHSGFSSSLFISLVDLGSVAAFRLENSAAAQVPSIELKDLFSPGIFWSLGIPKTPLSLGLGAQIGPNLRKVTAEENKYANSTYVRYSVSLSVDIPLLNLYTKSRK